ncbi:unnamed protein product [Rhizoctonia solani]|uniref:CHAT domain-containing protein n=1 Tax=Rhizoctonia solani TaxID=456999 RepID=A0A8H3AQG1_9AGAM|nr:unnamed protein product [Rhizoctonia solani]
MMDQPAQPKLQEIDEEIEAFSLLRSEDPDDPFILNCLATAHTRRFDLGHELEDTQKAIEYASAGLALAPTDKFILEDLLRSLGTAHGGRFQSLCDLDDVEKSIEYKSRALAMTPDDDPYLPVHLANLAISHKDRFEQLGEPGDIEKAIEYDSRALGLTSQGHPGLPDFLSGLGSSLRYRFRRFGELADIEKAIELQSRGLALTPDGHMNLPSMLANLGASHSDQYQRLGRLDDLEKAIEYESRALGLTPNSHPKLPLRLSNLGSSYIYRFHRLGVLDDLEKAIQYESQAVALTSDSHPDLPVWLGNLGGSYSYQFHRLGQLGDLKKAIEYGSRALELTPKTHPQLPRLLINLGAFHIYQFERLGELHDLEKAIEYESRALIVTPDDHPGLSSTIANLGASYHYRFEQLGEPDDLEQGLKHGSRALALTPDGHPYLSRRLINLGIAHRIRFRLSGKLNDIENAIEYQSCALARIAGDDPNYCVYHFNLALSYINYHQHSRDPVHLEKSLTHFSMACSSVAGAPRDRFRHAYRWAACASECVSLDPIRAYQATIDLLPQFIWLGSTTDQRYQDLRTVETLALNAARAAVNSSNPGMALEWLEHARCIVWNQNLMLRSPLDQLQDSHPIVATRLREVANQLRIASSESREGPELYSASGLIDSEQIGQRHRRLAREYDELLTQVRAIPGFDKFLRPIRVNRLLCAAQYGVIVVINCHEDRCDALFVLPNEHNIAHLTLPDFSRTKALAVRSKINSSLGSTGLRERGVHVWRELGGKDEFTSALASLWDDVVKPILDFLQYTADSSTENLPHITWCPTGAASFLPLHAAGNYDQPHSRIYNYAVSSYTPTITALLASSPSSLNRDSRVLAIGQAATPGHQPLPGTATELSHVKSHVESKAKYSQLIDTQATPSIVLDAMEQHDWVHLACHAYQNVYDPTKSGFFLQGDTEGTEASLDLATINRRSFNRKGLAFLSACQTATGDETLPDEAVHLASGMLMGGYSSVIATMWSVVDEDAPFVADRVYAQLMIDGKLGNGEAGRALHCAVSGLREKVGEREFARWVPYIHIGS